MKGPRSAFENFLGDIMYVSRFSIKNQQKIVSGIDELGMKSVSEWFSKFAHKENSIVKIELSSIDIERIFKPSLFFKGDLTPENNISFEELVLEDVLDYNLFGSYQVTPTMFGHPIVLKRKLDYDSLHNSIYCFKGTLKAIEKLMNSNSLQWSSKSNRTDLENRIINRMKHPRVIHYETAFIYNEDYELVDTIFDTDTMEELIENEEIPSWIRELIQERLVLFSESQEQDPNTYLDDYIW